MKVERRRNVECRRQKEKGGITRRDWNEEMHEKEVNREQTAMGRTHIENERRATECVETEEK